MKSPTSTKVSEKVSFDDDKMIIKSTFDANQMLDDARYAREKAEHAFAGDYKLIGQVDMALVNVWLKEAGVSWQDTHAVNDVLKRKLMSNEFSALRVWDGRW